MTTFIEINQNYITSIQNLYNVLENRLSKSTLLPRSGSNWLKLSAANPEPYIETTPPPLLISRIGILDTLADG